MPRVFLVLTLFAAGCTRAAPGTWYVAPGGSDGVSCSQAKSAATPKATITAALACVGTAASRRRTGQDRTEQTWPNRVCRRDGVITLSISLGTFRWIAVAVYRGPARTRQSISRNNLPDWLPLTGSRLWTSGSRPSPKPRVQRRKPASGH